MWQYFKQDAVCQNYYLLLLKSNVHVRITNKFMSVHIMYLYVDRIFVFEEHFVALC